MKDKPTCLNCRHCEWKEPNNPESHAWCLFPLPEIPKMPANWYWDQDPIYRDAVYGDCSCHQPIEGE